MRFSRLATALAIAGALTATSAQAVTEISFWHAMEGPLGDRVNAIVAAFNKANPDIELTWVRDSTGIITAKLLAEKANPKADVVMGVAATSMAVFDAEGMLQPYAPPGRASLTLRHRPVFCPRHMRHRPHATLNGTDTRSPTLRNSTSLPFSTISPVISCPSTRPCDAVVRPRTMCWSEPQMLDATTLRIAPCSIVRPFGSASFGDGIFWTSTLPVPR